MLLATTPFAANFIKRLAVLSAVLALPAVGAAQTISGFLPTVGTCRTAAKAATSVTITGLNLGSTTSVRLNGQTMPIVSKNAFTLVVTVPQAASTGKLVVTLANGGVAVSSSQFGITRSSSGTRFPQATAKGASFNAIKVASSSNGYYSTPVVADLTGNDRADLLIGNANGNIEYWQQLAVNGASYSKIGNLQAAGADIKVANFAKPTVTDLDGDGLLDLVVGTGTDRHLARYEQTKAGATTFQLVGNLMSGTTTLLTGDNFPRPTIADLDGNGKLDLLVGDYSGVIKHYEASDLNSASFGLIGNVQVDGADLRVDGTAKPLLFDLDGDGLLDFIVGSQSGAVTRYSQTARYATTFKSLGSLTTDGSSAITMGTAGNNEGGFSAPTITDLDGNGRLDMLMGDANGTLYRYEQAQATPLNVSPLPVELTAFSGQATSTGNQLSWATASELNSASFVVERSADGVAFGTVSTVAAAGSSSTARTYQYTDATAPAGTTYYRLRQVDQDGSNTYSAVVVLVSSYLATATKAIAYPAPFADELSVQLPSAAASQAATITLLTTDGRQVYTSSVQLSATPQALAGLPALAPGIYLLRTTTVAGTTTQRINHI